MTLVRRDVRYRDGGFEMKCRACGEFWPLDEVCWQPKHGLARCRACWRIYFRLSEARRRTDDSIRLAHNAANRTRYWSLPHAERRRRADASRRWKQEHPERVAIWRENARRRREAAA